MFSTDNKEILLATKNVRLDSGHYATIKKIFEIVQENTPKCLKLVHF